mmetsp:Transcript_23847/g.58329  ORF Transcript_23847/g.58329 Transcript_23847/m.58329 type:complete len:172 (+) Transcript_23847:157-672(+)|eukprot:CAMPEP_0113602340 /NCGR_PEP_ID=MMETSP0017_2-20120614/703_1 /TAXON_ID=2856 /ORGANISM="Cylindrotheca closterium" /LENGTH=171 /DNA_ID=CAMNT_0000510679 /DNA_START=144 /DNA_END=659 /DNA_ORIENTATION=- /assembly_acc=CAM_ASM_000147
MVATRRRAITYAIGDRVELVRTEGIDIGILLSQADDEDYNIPHWIVSVEGMDTEEVVSEKTLGRVLDGQESDDSSTKSTVKKATEKKVVKKTSTKTKPKSNNRKTVKAKSSKTRSSKSKGQENMLEAPRKHATPRARKQDGDEKVTEIKMKTGILFMYRGTNHRVEFVRTV